MNCCSCEEKSVLYGDDAYQYAKRCLIRLDVAFGGWEQLWQCNKCNSHWKMSWENSQGGFDNGIITLKKMTPEQVEQYWKQKEGK